MFKNKNFQKKYYKSRLRKRKRKKKKCRRRRLLLLQRILENTRIGLLKDFRLPSHLQYLLRLPLQHLMHLLLDLLRPLLQQLWTTKRNKSHRSSIVWINWVSTRSTEKILSKNGHLYPDRPFQNFR